MGGDALEAARAYLDLGWRVVLVLPRQKRPALARWQELRLEPADLPRYFCGATPDNVGVLLGEPSGHLADIDLDCAESVELAPRILPPTWTFGRPGRPCSHWIYVAEGAGSEKFLDGRATLIELRSTGGQTVFPPSIHPSGEAVAWTEDMDGAEAPTTIDTAALRELAVKLATGTTIYRHAGRVAALAWLAGGQAPALPVEVERAVNAWWGLPRATREPARRPAVQASGELREAVDRYNREHARELPRSGRGECPICGHRECFGALPDSPGRWACFSASHSGAGIQGESCWTGDFLDLDAHASGMEPVELLRREGYLAGRAA